MAFESNTLVNGEWTTRTLDVDTVLRHYDQQDNQPTANIMDREHPPLWGLLTQTIIRSPLVNWILPVSLRDPSIHDVAFIGVSTFQFPPLPCLLIFAPTYSEICQSLHAHFDWLLQGWTSLVHLFEVCDGISCRSHLSPHLLLSDRSLISTG
jgi:hypothetical protein